ncbi:MAG: AraC family transcriptional regulator [Turicibacter sp.]
MESLNFDIWKYFEDNVKLEDTLAKCSNVEEITKAFLSSNLYKNMNREMYFDHNIRTKEMKDRAECTYELQVDFKINAGLRYTRTGAFPPRMNHKHNYYEMIYVCQGAYKQEIQGKLITLNAGDACILNQNVRHKDFEITRHHTVLFFCFSNDFFDNHLKDFTNKNQLFDQFVNINPVEKSNRAHYLLFRSKHPTNSYLIVQYIILEYFNRQVGSHYLLLGLFMRLFYTFTTRYESAELMVCDQTKLSRVWEMIEAYVDEHLADLSRDKLAEVLHYNANYINTIVKQTTGQTFSEYVCYKRIEMAVELLKNSEMSVNQIIKEVGYQNKSYFYKIFTSKYGITPQEFRMTVKKNLSS